MLERGSAPSLFWPVPPLVLRGSFQSRSVPVHLRPGSEDRLLARCSSASMSLPVRALEVLVVLVRVATFALVMLLSCRAIVFVAVVAFVVVVVVVVSSAAVLVVVAVVVIIVVAVVVVVVGVAIVVGVPADVIRV